MFAVVLLSDVFNRCSQAVFRPTCDAPHLATTLGRTRRAPGIRRCLRALAKRFMSMYFFGWSRMIRENKVHQ